MADKLSSAGITLDVGEVEALGEQTQKLIDEYKEGMEKIQKELQKKAQELVEAKKKIGELAAKKQIDDQLLNKQVEDIKKLKS